MLMKTFVDFHYVAPEHKQIDARLQNWAKWCTNTSSPKTSPMFRLAISTARARSEYGFIRSDIDRMDAQKLAKGVAGLPEQHRFVLNWCYLKPTNPSRICRQLGATMEGLMLMLRDGRQLLIHRNI